MKLTITKATNRVELIKFFRQDIKDLPLQEAIYYVNNLPYSFVGLSSFTVKDLQERIKNFADSEIEKEIEDIEYDTYNCNINPPPEFIQAMAWYETLSSEEKKHVDQLSLWWNRPAVC